MKTAEQIQKVKCALDILKRKAILENDLIGLKEQLYYERKKPYTVRFLFTSESEYTKNIVKIIHRINVFTEKLNAIFETLNKSL